jgi:hypothetical protein
MEAALEHQMTPDELAFREHVAGAEFQAGLDAGRWRLLSMTWPTAILAVGAGPRAESPREFFFCFDLTAYPANATACPIDISNGQLLPAGRRPKGEIVGHAFRTDWMEGRALYVPWDRIAIEGHPEWRTRHAGKLWSEEAGILSYLRPTHELLDSEDYEGV